jgi:ATP-dependent Lon protease
VILPEQNRKDLEEVPEHVQKNLKFHFVTNIEQVVSLAFNSPRGKGR